jgi:hypothetical protein
MSTEVLSAGFGLVFFGKEGEKRSVQLDMQLL